MAHIYITHFEQPEKMKHTAEHKAGLSLLSRALSELYNIQIAPENLDEQMDKNKYGKPFLKNHPEIHFNISHGSDIAICAVSNQNIGVDIEKIRDFHSGILRKVFTEDENIFFRKVAVSEDEKQLWFFRFWTLKESRIKHAGIGLSMSLTNFSFSFDIEKDPYEINCSDKDLYFKQYQLEDDYILSVCLSDHNETVDIIRI